MGFRRLVGFVAEKVDFFVGGEWKLACGVGLVGLGGSDGENSQLPGTGIQFGLGVRKLACGEGIMEFGWVKWRNLTVWHWGPI